MRLCYVVLVWIQDLDLTQEVYRDTSYASNSENSVYGYVVDTTIIKLFVCVR